MKLGILLITRRPDLADAAYEAASQQGPVVGVTHGFTAPWATGSAPLKVPYTVMINWALAIADFNALAKWDDHDEYPENYLETHRQTYSGKPALGRALVRDCDTRKIVGGTSTLAAGILPTWWRAIPSTAGRVDNQPGHVVPTGVVKLRCGDWSWLDSNPWTCSHSRSNQLEG